MSSTADQLLTAQVARSAIENQLAICGHNLSQEVEVQVDQKSVVLSGTVNSYYLKQLAQEAAFHVCPNRKLSNQICVARSVPR